MVYSFRILLLVLALAPFVYYLLCLYSVFDYFGWVRKLPPHRNDFAPPVSILKPVCGVDDDAYENFASFCRLDYPEYEIVFAARDLDDPVLPVIQKLQRDFPERSIRLVAGVPSRGANKKVNSLCQLVREARHELLVISDSDVRVDCDYLRNAVAPFSDAQVGAVTSFFRGVAMKGLTATLNALGMYTDSAPAALVARKLEGKVQFAFGWTMATTKRVLDEIGGFESMADHHSDDFELGNRIAKAGYRIEFLRTPVWMMFPNETLGGYMRHELRWAIGLRNVRSVGYLGMVFTHGLPWTLAAAAAALASGWTGIAAAYFTCYLVLRLGLVWITGGWGFGDGRTMRKLYLVPLRDALSFVTWAGGLFLDKIVWRGFSYRVIGGRLVPIERGAFSAQEQPLARSARVSWF